MGLLIRTNNKGRVVTEVKKCKMKSNWKKRMIFYNCVTTGVGGLGFEKLPHTFRKDFGGDV